MSFSISPTQSDVQSAMRQFLLAVLPVGVEVFSGLSNKVGEPSATQFVEMLLLRWKRLATNLDVYTDVVFTGSISGTTMVVDSMGDDSGPILVGANIFGDGVPDGVIITSQISSNSFGVSQSLSITESQTISAGGYTLTQAAEAVFQLDVHSVDNKSSDLAQIVSTSFRDEFATNFFSNLISPLDSISPLYADDPVVKPTFINAEKQYEWVLMIEAHLQVNQFIRAPIQFADAANIQVISVEATYPIE